MQEHADCTAPERFAVSCNTEGSGCTVKTGRTVTMADWQRARSFDKAAIPGDAVEDAIVEEFVNCLPPTTYRKSLVQCGEPYSFAKDPRDGKTKSTYCTFHREDGIWYYSGNCFAGEYVEPAKLA